jgi:hypothetical protein
LSGTFHAAITSNIELMARRPAKVRVAALVVLAFAGMHAIALAQLPPPDAASTLSESPTISADRPLPDVVALMHDVEANQRKSEAIEKNYIYHSVATEQEDDSHGQVKKTTVTESDHFWVSGVPVRRTTKKDGKALTPDEVAKENERIDKLAAKSSERRDKADAKGKQTDARGDEEVSVSRLIELGAFTNARRVQLNGRDTIAVDFTGDPKAKTRNRAEDVIRDLAGTAWIDEQDHVLARAEGHFVNSFKIAGGLVANVQKDTSFSMVQSKINDEVWLPAHFEGRGSFHALLFFGFNGNVQIVNSDFRKFRATSTVLPVLTPVAPGDATQH